MFKHRCSIYLPVKRIVSHSLSGVNQALIISRPYKRKGKRAVNDWFIFFHFYLIFVIPCYIFKEYLKLLKRFMKSVNWPKDNLFNNFKYSLKFNFFKPNLMIPLFYLRLFHVIIWICRWRRNTLVTSQYQPRLSSINQNFLQVD
jgi:hypothetical protein